MFFITILLTHQFSSKTCLAAATTPATSDDALEIQNFDLQRNVRFPDRCSTQLRRHETV